MEIQELGRISLIAAELETLDLTLSKQKKLTECTELCIKFPYGWNSFAMPSFF